MWTSFMVASCLLLGVSAKPQFLVNWPSGYSNYAAANAPLTSAYPYAPAYASYVASPYASGPLVAAPYAYAPNAAYVVPPAPVAPAAPAAVASVGVPYGYGSSSYAFATTEAIQQVPAAAYTLPAPAYEWFYQP